MLTFRHWENLKKNLIYDIVHTCTQLFICFSGFLTSSSATRLYRGRVPRLTPDNFTCSHTETERGDRLLSQPVIQQQLQQQQKINLKNCNISFRTAALKIWTNLVLSRRAITSAEQFNRQLTSFLNVFEILEPCPPPMPFVTFLITYSFCSLRLLLFPMNIST